MADLTQPQKDLLRLILRSPDLGEGWRQVSQTLWKSVTHYRHPDLTEIDEEKRRIRLTPDGAVVVKYAL